MNRFLGYIFSPIHYILFGLLLVIFHPIQWLSLKLGGYKAHKTSVEILNYLLVGTYYIMGSRMKFICNHSLPVGRPIIFIANHQSMYDIPPMIWHFRRHHPKFISKIELTRGIPSISFNLKHGGAANIDRNDPKQSITEILKLAQRMRENNWSAVIFPEGTRSKNGKMRKFAVGGLNTLLKKVPGALVVPVAIDGSWKLTRFGSFPLSFGEKMSWRVLQPVEPAGRPVEEVISETENAIKQEIDP